MPKTMTWINPIINFCRIRWITLVLLFIIFIAAILRFQNIGAIEHNVDHAYPIWQALMTLDRGYLPVTAQGTSVLFANPALTGYLYVPWVALTRSPFGPYLFTAVLNTLAVWFCFRAASLLLDPRRGLIAAFLMAVNPWVIEYSRATWVQGLIPFFASCLFWLLVPIFLRQARQPGRRLVLALITLTAMTQTYLLAFAIVLPVGVLLLIYRRHLDRRSLLIGMGVFALASAIYAFGLLANSADTLNQLQSFSSGGSHLSSEALSHGLRLVSGRNYPVARGQNAPAGDWVSREYLTEGANALIVACMLIGALISGVNLWKKANGSTQGLIPLIWFGLPILMMSYVSKPVHPFYLLLTLPAGYVIAAQGIGWLARWRWSQLIILVTAAAFGLLMGVNTVRFAEGALAHPGADGLGALPVSTGIEMVHQLIEPTHPGLVLADVDEWTLNSLSGRLYTVKRDINTKQVTYINPTRITTYHLRGEKENEVAPLGVVKKRTFPLNDGLFLAAYDVVQTSLVQNGLSQPIQSDQGISFTGWSLMNPPVPGKTVELLTEWVVAGTNKNSLLLAPFVHVLDHNGKQIVNVSGTLIPGNTWGLGDYQLQRIPISIPADAVGPFAFKIGQYDGVHNINAIFTLPDGTANAEITLTP